jgi:toxin ParE1/3/4
MRSPNTSAATHRNFARAVARKLLGAGRNLGRYPLSGSTVREWGEPTLRQVLVYSYRVIYRVRADTVTILTVVHGKRLLDDSPPERPA